ncbi:Vacuolar morphogenesis protein 6 [Naganishia albida]|nr:Vacuolar morphogenesis protein 6 [Naganishia albida]
MPPFTSVPLVSGIKHKPEALLHVGETIYVAAGGALQVYEIQYPQDVGSSVPKAKLVRTKKAIARRPVDQLGWIEDTNTLVVLSDSQVTLWDLPELRQPTVLTSLKNVQSFGVHSSRQRADSLVPRKKKNPSATEPAREGEVRMSTLLVGCRKKVAVMSWSGGKPLGGTRDLVLPHSPRLIIFPSQTSPSPAHLHVSPSEYYILRIFDWPAPSAAGLTFAEGPGPNVPTSFIGTERRLAHGGGGGGGGATSDPAATGGEHTSAPATTTTAGGTAGPSATNAATAAAAAAGGGGGVSGAFSGLGGYMGKGLGVLRAGSGTSAAGKIVGCAVAAAGEDAPRGGQVLVVREGAGVFVQSDGTPVRDIGIAWPAAPDDIAFTNPYILSVLPPGSSASEGSSSIQIRLDSTLTVQQSIRPPVHAASSSPAAGTTAAQAGASVRCLSTSAATTRPPSSSTLNAVGGPVVAVYVTTPNDKLQLQTDGCTLWALRMEPWRDQVDEVLRNGWFNDGLGLVRSLRGLPDAVDKEDLDEYERRLKTLSALSLFSTEQWTPAFEQFMQLDITPAKIVALFPADQISGRLHVPRDQWVSLFGGPPGGRLVPAPVEDDDAQPKEKKDARGVLGHIPHLGLGRRPSSDTLADKASLRESVRTVGGEAETGSSEDEVKEFAAAVENLMIYLSDRRQKLAGAIANLDKPLPPIDSLPPLKTVTPTELLHYPSVPMTELTPEELVGVSQIVYTALIKVYLMIRPSLVGSLCRIENWCEVEEVEELLKERSRFSDLIDLYQGKKMHQKALGLLREQSLDEEDKLDKLDPTIRYLQKLGPKHVDLIFSEAKWVFGEDAKMASRIFIADEPEVEALPRHRVAEYLEQLDKPTCVRYLEHIIDELGEAGPDFHDKLAELYLAEVRRQWIKGNEAYKRLLEFLQNSTQYRPERLLGRSEMEDMPRARALLLGRLGNHEAALQIYVNRLESYSDAEDYCAKIYQTQPDPKGVFLQLLRIYLSPNGDQQPKLEPALRLIATHGTRVDAQEVLALLPSFIAMHDVQEFFVKTLRDGHAKMNQSRITKQLLKTRKEQVDRGLMKMQQKRVRITDIRICPQCHKRIGQSAIAVHAPSGVVTHYQCRRERR